VCVCTSLIFLKQGTDAQSTGGPYYLVLFRCVRIHARGSDRLSECISEAPAGRVFVKFDIADFNYILSRNTKFRYDRTKISNTLQEHHSTWYYCRRQEIAVQGLCFD